MTAPGTNAEVVRGWLSLSVDEASGRTKLTQQDTWDTTAQVPGLPVEAFVKVELRGGPRNVKAQTKKKAIGSDQSVTWQETLQLEVLEGSEELRLMVCREKYNNQKKGTQVLAACGIYVKDILEAVPIDKYFELFKPNNGGEGGFIRISMNYGTDLAELNKAPATASTSAAAGSQAAAAPAKKSGGAFKSILKCVVGLGLAAGAAFAAGVIVKEHKKKNDKK